MTEYEDFERLVGDYGRARAQYANILSQDLDERSGAEAALTRDYEAEFGIPLDFAELNEHGRGVAANSLRDFSRVEKIIQSKDLSLSHIPFLLDNLGINFPFRY